MSVLSRTLYVLIDKSIGVEITYLLTSRNFLHAKFTLIKKAYGSSNCWLSFPDIISTTFCQVCCTVLIFLQN